MNHRKIRRVHGHKTNNQAGRHTRNMVNMPGVVTLVIIVIVILFMVMI